MYQRRRDREVIASLWPLSPYRWHSAPVRSRSQSPFVPRRNDPMRPSQRPGCSMRQFQRFELRFVDSTEHCSHILILLKLSLYCPSKVVCV